MVFKLKFCLIFFALLLFFSHVQFGLVLLAVFVVAINGDVAEKQPATNPENSVKEKRAIHIATYHSSPYVYHSPVVYHHSAPLIHAAPIVHSAPIIHAAPIVHHPVVATHHVVSHAPLVSYHYGRR